MLRWQAAMGTLNARLAQLHVPSTAGPALADPVLVLGPWRSGTTAMHELLAAATGLATPRTWQCMNATTFTTLPPRRRDHATVARPMDGLAIHAQSPQEDEFALLSLGADTAYRAFLMPHRLAELEHTLAPAHWLADEHWLTLWERFLADVLRSSPQARQPLLLKSPNHSFRLPAILRRFPDTRVVWMLRDGAAVYHSNLKMWHAMFERYGLSAPTPGALEAFLAKALHTCAEVLTDSAEAFAQGRWALVEQSRLRVDAQAVVREVCARLQLPLAEDQAAWASALAATAMGREDRYLATLPPHVERAVHTFDAAQAQALRRMGGG